MVFEATAKPHSHRLAKALKSFSGKFCTAAFIAVTLSLLSFPGEVQSSIKSSIIYCLTVLTPSLFPFMALTSFAVNSGVSQAFGRIFGFVVRHVFRLPEICAAPIIMSFIGGYPAGAKAVSSLLRDNKITEEQAGRMMLFCVNPGIAFVVTFLGGAVLKSYRAGWLLFLSVTTAGLLLGIVSGLGVHVPKRESFSPQDTAGGVLIRSATDAAASVLKMCACIVLFSGFTAILHGTGAFQAIARLFALTGLLTPMEAATALSFIIEVTGGAGTASVFRAGPAMYAFGAAFGGLCVHMQIFSFFEQLPTKKLKFFLFRFLHGFLACGICRLFTALLPGDFIAAAAPVGAVSGIASLSGSPAGGLSLLLMCMAFLIITTKNEALATA